MKAKIITAVIGLTVTTIVPVYADGIQSPRGISQSAWNASAAYQNFQCPDGTSRGEGVDMNYTTDRSDDYYFVTCDPIIYIPTTPSFSYPTPTVTETATATTVVTTPVTNTETTTAITSSTTNTSSATSSVTTSTLTNSELITLILDLFNKLIALLSQLK